MKLNNTFVFNSLFMKYLYVLLSFFIASCGSIKTINNISNQNLDKVEPSSFNTIIPFEIDDSKSIVLNAKLGNDSMNYYFKLDTHAPTSIDESFINAANFKFLGALKLINKKTPTGDNFEQKYYKLNYLQIGSIKIMNSLFLALPSQKSLNNKYIGLLGNDILAKGVVFIDFENNLLHFSNSIDSFGIKNDKIQINGVFHKSDKITFDEILINNREIKLELDLGYNGSIILDKENFNKVDVNKTAEIRTGHSKTVSSIKKGIYKVLDSADVNISGKIIPTNVVNVDIIKKTNFIGLGFFSRFKYVIIDYPNKKFYVSKELRIP